jgi:hypothetical protein
MGSLSDTGGNWPPDGGVPDGLPGLPPEWGDIVVPDDISSLSAEVAAVRAELHREQDRTAWQRFARRIGLRRDGHSRAAALRGPALIIAMAVLVTLASLWASAWPGPTRPSSNQRTANGTDSRSLPALELIGTDGQTVPLRGQLPAVILLIDGCVCAQLVADTALAVKPEVAVVTVVSGPAAGTGAASAPAGSPPARTAGAAVPTAGPAVQTAGTGAGQPTAVAPPQAGVTVRQLRDPTDELRSTFFELAAPDGNAAVLLVSRTGEIVRILPRTASIEDIRPDLARL